MKVSVHIMVNTILFCDLTEVSCFKFLLQSMAKTITIMQMPLNQWSSSSFTYMKRFQKKKWRLSVAYLNLPITDFLFLCYLQQLFICSEPANSRLKNTILVTYIAFHLAPLTLLTKKMLSTSERKRSQRSHVKDYFVFMQFSNTTSSV